MGNCLLLDAQQIASILHDYFAEHAAELFQDECAAALESYLVLDRGNVRAVCAFGGDDAIIDWQRVIDKLPHGGDRAFVLHTEELRALGKGNAKLLRRDVRFAQRKATALPPEYVRLMTWNEVELKELLSLLRRHSSNLNQLVRRVNTTGRVYEADLEDIIKRQSELWEAIGQILTRLAEIS